jgi:uncharacterized protein (DUF58 family)
MMIRRRYHPTISFVLFAGVTVLLGIGAINSQNNLLFFCFGSALAALLVSGFVSGSALMRVRLRRASVGEAFVGEPLRIVYEVAHLGRGLPAFALHIEERAGGFVRDQARANWPKFMSKPRAFLPFVGRGASAHAEAIVTPSRRGVASLGEVRIVTTFPFGAIKKSVSFVPGPDGDGRLRVFVRPVIVDLPPGLSNQIAHAALDSERSSNRVGRGDEFFGLREYSSGDSVRRIAWRSTARLGELVVREDASFDSSRVIVILRLSRRAPSAERDLADERAISLAASAVLHAGRRGIAVGLAVPSLGAYSEPGSGDALIATMLDGLAEIDLHAPEVQRLITEEPRAERDAVVIVDADSATIEGMAIGAEAEGVAI